MSFDSPIWLLMLAPMALAWWLWRGPTATVHGLRGVLLLLVVVAMAGPTLRLPDRSGTVVVVADRSASMPAEAEARQRELIDMLVREMGQRDRLAVVSFGRRVAVERQPEVGRFGGFVQSVDVDGSDLGAALERAAGLVPSDGGGRVLVLSDGLWTGRNPMLEAGRASARGLAIDYRLLTRSRANDVAVQRFEVPHRVSEGEAFLMHAWVQTPVAQPVAYELRRGDRVLARGEREMTMGVSRLTFRDHAASAGVRRYTLHVTGAADDPVPENNTAEALVDVEGRRPMLVVTESAEPRLAGLLEAGGLAVDVRPPGAVDWSLAGLSGYAGVLLENVPADRVGARAMERLAVWVNEAGGGLMLTGGRRSFGPGGYFESPLDPLLPVSMELRQEHRKLTLAVLVTLDRSGSMNMPVAGGRTKMELANLGTAKTLDMLSPMDEFGVLAVDTRPHVIVPMQRVPDEPSAMRNRVLRMASMGGGIYIEEALLASERMLDEATAATRHLILFSDAQDSVQEGRYREILRDFERKNITVSVIGLGSERDIHAELLRDIAARGNGRIYFTDDANRLPELFAQDMVMVARSTFVDEPTPIRATAGLVSLLGRSLPDPPAVGGYNLTYLRPGATLAMHSVDEYEAPVVAGWQAGLGRAVVYTGEADGQFTGPIAQWPQVGELLTSLARWTVGEDDDTPTEIVITQRLDRGTQIIELHVDAQWAATELTQLPTVTTLRDSEQGEPRREQTPMHWVAADRLVAEVPLHGQESALSIVHLPGHGQHRLAPVRLPYSPEFAPVSESGARTLAQLARATGGQERISVAGMWGDLPRLPQRLPVGHWLLIAAIVVLLAEVLERRTGLLGRMVRLPRVVWWRTPRPAGNGEVQVSDDDRVPRTAHPATSASADATSPKPVEPPAATPAGALANAMAQAQRRAAHRHDRT
ncbi:VWA domain-containing protein [Phycisphaerales bacterium AB-hyl4]|uniref:VWA domain-containing protein n=1 Tax=Natronomicrosphaera hydrolytica TaxID=3242702 RepID=A0ABV4U774_9BACT